MFAGSDAAVQHRFRIGRVLGIGAHGRVVEAVDMLTGDRVALKKLRSDDPAAIYRFKKEFRAFADVVHPNLVRLFELFAAGDEWLLSMELIEGDDLVTHARRHPAQLAALLRQLADGLAEIHGAGKLHRDLKPSNVLVTADGRVVILDFGLVARRQDGRAVHVARERVGVVGTPAYVAPEVVAEQPATPAADWYAVGVMLFEVLTGRLPFEGSPLEVLRRKTADDAPAVEALAPAAPQDLALLATRLLARDPRARPAPVAIARALGTVATRDGVGPRPPAFVGRAAELAALEAAFETTRAGRAVLVRIRGESGVGKSALVERFLRERAEREDALVLAGRCYERESIPFKAIDGVLDAIARHLGGDPRTASRLPHDTAALAQMFPSILRVRAVADAATRASLTADPTELRRRAFAALTELLGSLRDTGPVVIHIDDLQWGDVDSSHLLGDLLARHDLAPLLLIVSHRPDELDRHPVLGPLARIEARDGLAVRDLEVPPLAGPDAEALVRDGLGVTDPARGAALVREAGGNPLLLEELVRAAEHGPVRLADVLRRRIDDLAAPARRLLEVVCIAGHPVALDLARAAAEIDATGASLAELRAGRFVHLRPAGAAIVVEPFHDRVRELVAGVVEAEARATGLHLALAEAMERLDESSHERLALHFDLGGDRARARRHAIAAAHAAVAALAFDRAVSSYRRALAAGDATFALIVGLADALAWSGRPREAAHQFLAASDHAPTAVERRALRRRAAEQLLRGGHFDEGMPILRDALGEVGLGFPATPRRALASLLWHRLALRFARPRPTPRALPPAQSERMEACFAAGLGLANTDMVRGMGFLSRHLRMALASGDPDRMARGLGLEAMFTAGGGDHARAEAMVAAAEDAASRARDPAAAIWPALGRAVTTFCRHRWRECVPAFDEVLRLAGEYGAGAWEVGTTKHFRSMALMVLGDGPALARSIPAYVRDAQERGDLYTESNLRTWASAELCLYDDRPADALDEIAIGIARWTRAGVHLQHAHASYVRIMVALYEGDPGRAARHAAERIDELRRSGLMRIEPVRMHVFDIFARAMVARGDARDIGAARSAIRRIARQRLPLAIGIAAALRASVAYRGGDRHRACVELAVAEDAFRANHAILRAAAARRARGTILAADGAALIASADAEIAACGVRAPARMARMLMPGFEH